MMAGRQAFDTYVTLKTKKKHKTVTEMSHLGAEPSPVPVPATTHTTVD